MPENYKESKKKELLGLIEIYENDPVSYINNLIGEGGKTIRIGLEDDEKKDYLRALAKKNNPIKLQK